MTREECEEYEERGYQRHLCRLTGRVEWTNDVGECRCMVASNDTVKEENDAK